MLTNDVNFLDGRRQLHSVSKGVLHLKSMKKINKHWKLKGMQEKGYIMDVLGYRKLHPSGPLPDITRAKPHDARQWPFRAANVWIKSLTKWNRKQKLIGVAFFITKTCLYSFDPLKPHFYTVKLGFTGVYVIFLISAQNIDCGYSARRF